MKTSLFHLNIWEGAFIDQIIEFIQDHDFDILHFQEVNSGRMSRGGYYSNSQKENHTPAPLSPTNIGVDMFKILKEKLPYAGSQEIVWKYLDDPQSYVSNATFFKPEFTILDKKVIRHNPRRDLTDDTFFPIEDHPRASIALLLEKDGQKFWSINTHLAWGPTPKDADYKMQQAKQLYDFVSELTEPFILSGDFNMTPDTEVVQMFGKLGKNLTREFGVTNTLNSRVHKAKQLFPPGIAVDHMFVSSQITVEKYDVIEDNLSDHLGIAAQLHL